MLLESAYFDELKAVAERYMGELGAGALRRTGDPELPRALHDYTAYLHVHGAIKGGLFLSVEAGLAFELTRGFVIGPVTDDEAVDWAVDTVAEMANIIGGNALANRERQDIHLGQPVMFVSRRAEIRTKSERFLLQRFTAGTGSAMLLFIPVDQEAELASIIVIDKQSQDKE